MKLAYLDCFSGASGDMFLGALLDLGLKEASLLEELQKLPLTGWKLQVSRVMRGGISGTNVKVIVDDPQHHRNLEDIKDILNASRLDADIIEISTKVFATLARVEALVHGTAEDEVHFHEVGAMDAIIDVVGAVTGLKLLDIQKTYVSPLPVGSGWVSSSHGALPLPAPATAYLLRGFPVYGTPTEVELITPTGAVLIATLTTPAPAMPPMKLEAVGYGAGSRELQRPNLLRLFLGCGDDSLLSGVEEEEIAVIEVSLDDLNPEIYPYVTEKLMACGAYDVFLASLIMKKGRPGVLITVLCPISGLKECSEVIFTETSTLGFRWRVEKRWKLLREWLTVNTICGPVRVKYGRASGPEGSIFQIAPEFEDCRKLAHQNGIPLAEVYSQALELARRELKGSYVSRET